MSLDLYPSSMRIERQSKIGTQKSTKHPAQKHHSCLGAPQGAETEENAALCDTALVLLGSSFVLM